MEPPNITFIVVALQHQAKLMLFAETEQISFDYKIQEQIINNQIPYLSG
jgi:hypothetical protein